MQEKADNRKDEGYIFYNRKDKKKCVVPAFYNILYIIGPPRGGE